MGFSIMVLQLHHYWSYNYTIIGLTIPPLSAVDMFVLLLSAVPDSPVYNAFVVIFT